MDHLPKISKPVSPPFEVPCVSLETSPYYYDGLDWWTFPVRVNWTKPNETPFELREAFLQVGKKLTEEINSFIQAWLYFGLLSNILGLLIKPSSLSRTQGPVSIIDTTSLPTLLQDWKFRLRSRSIDDVSRHTTETLLSTTELVFESLGFDSEEKIMESGIDQRIILSILILFETLSSTIGQAYFVNENESIEFSWHDAPHTKPLPKAALTLRLKTQGWCPSDIGWIRNHMSNSFGYYLTLFGPRFSEGDYSGCTDAQCSALNIDESTYKTKHHSCPGCVSAPMDMDFACEIIHRGSFPILCMRKLEDGTYNLCLAPYSQGAIYVAISHVWRDGLGNPNENSLPICQLFWLCDRLGHLTSQDQGPGGTLPHLQKDQELFFWIDTMCVPTKNYSLPRKIAITRMVEVYRNAAAVLVLDQVLSRTPIVETIQTILRYRPEEFEKSCGSGGSAGDSPGSDSISEAQISGEVISQAMSACGEICTRIILSNWRRRLWTLQESASARRLVFSFDDMVLDIDNLWSSFNSGAFYLLSNQVAPSFVEVEAVQNFELAVGSRLRKGSISGIMRNAFNKIDNLNSDPVVEICIAAQERNTSLRGDQFICLATLLEFNERSMTKLLNIPGEDRFREFLNLQSKFPANFIFLETPKLRTKGLRWCPAPFITRAAYGSLSKSTSRIGIRAPFGLRVEMAGMLFNMKLGPGTIVFEIENTEEHTMYTVSRRNMKDGTPLGDPWNICLVPRKLCMTYGTSMMKAFRPEQNNLTWIDIVKSLAGAQHLAVILRDKPKWNSRVPGILVRVTNVMDDIIFVARHEYVLVGAFSSRVVSGSGVHRVKGSPVKEYQWCVD